MPITTSPSAESRLPHALAVLLVCATFLLICVGGLVTTYEAGMAVPDWPTTYGYNMFLYPWQTWVSGPWNVFVEHGHRLLGSLAGLLTIALVVAVWRRDDRRWMRYAALAALALVIFQGVLGGLRVRLDERLLAKIHGCVGPAFFALAVALAVFTSRRWRSTEPRREDAAAGKLQRLALLTTGFAYLQIVLGAQLRHLSPGFDPGVFRGFVIFHVAMALLLTVHILLVAARVWRRHRDQPALLRPATVLAGLLGLQLALGLGTWLVNYGWPSVLGEYAWSENFVVRDKSLPQSLVTTAHVAVGSLILGCSLVVALRSLRMHRRVAAGFKSHSIAMGVTA